MLAVMLCVYIYIYLLCVGCCHRHSPLLLSRRHVACRLPRPISGMRVESYGTGTQVRLPGKSSMEPRIFKFGTPYSEMYASMSATPEDEAFFVHNGVLQLCKRGSSVKVRFCVDLNVDCFGSLCVSCTKARPADIDVMVGNSAFTLDNLTSISYNISSHPNDGKTLPPKPYRLMM